MNKQELKKVAQDKIKRALGFDIKLKDIILLEYYSENDYTCKYLLFEIVGQPQVEYSISDYYKLTIFKLDTNNNIIDSINIIS